jgi:hypothetical protein
MDANRVTTEIVICQAVVRKRREFLAQRKAYGRPQECGQINLGDVDATKDEPLRIVYEFWRAAQSEYHYRPAGVVDLGEIS